MIYEEAAMMNIRADAIPRDSGFVYVEEFKEGTYEITKYGFLFKRTRIRLYFCRFVDFQADAVERERIREQIEDEIVLPFFKEITAADQNITEARFYNPLPRFDANEVSIMLEFTATEQMY